MEALKQFLADLGDPASFGFGVTALRMLLAMFFGGIIGIERGKKRRPAGFRTHMLVCMGASLAMCISAYLALELGYSASGQFGDASKTDVSRLGAQVINGIGFLGAGTVLVTNRQQIKGMTTAAGLWASACMGLAIGAGFYICAISAFVCITLTAVLFSPIERVIITRTRNMNISITLGSVSDLPAVIDEIKARGIHVFDSEIVNLSRLSAERPNAVIEMQLQRRQKHAEIISELAHLEKVLSIEEQ